jgi:hypothetical protein
MGAAGFQNKSPGFDDASVRVLDQSARLREGLVPLGGRIRQRQRIAHQRENAEDAAAEGCRPTEIEFIPVDPGGYGIELRKQVAERLRRVGDGIDAFLQREAEHPSSGALRTPGERVHDFIGERIHPGAEAQQVVAGGRGSKIGSLGKHGGSSTLAPATRRDYPENP